MIRTQLWHLNRVPFNQVAKRLNALYEGEGLLPLAITHIATTDGPGALLVVFGETQETEQPPAPAGADPAAAAAEPPQPAAAAPTAETLHATTEVTIDHPAPSNGSNGAAEALGEPEVIAAQ